MNALLRNALDSLKSKVEVLVSDNGALKKEVKQLQSEKNKLEKELAKASKALESEKNKNLATGIAQGDSSAKASEEKKKLVKQIDKYIKLIDTSVAQIKSKV